MGTRAQQGTVNKTFGQLLFDTFAFIWRVERGRKSECLWHVTKLKSKYARGQKMVAWCIEGAWDFRKRIQALLTFWQSAAMPHTYDSAFIYYTIFVVLCARLLAEKSDSVKFLAHPSQQMKLKCVLTLTDVSLVLKSMEIPSVPLTCVRHNHHPNSHPHTFHTSVPRGKQLSFISFVPPFWDCRRCFCCCSCSLL